MRECRVLSFERVVEEYGLTTLRAVLVISDHLGRMNRRIALLCSK